MNFLQTSRVYECCDQKRLRRPQELFQAFRQTKHAAASCTSPLNPPSRPCLSPHYLGSAEPVSWCGQGRLLCGGFIGATGHEVPAASPLTSLQHMAKALSCLQDWDYVCGKFCPRAGQHKNKNRTTAVVFGGCRDIVLGKRSHLSELPEGMEVRSNVVMVKKKKKRQ